MDEAWERLATCREQGCVAVSCGGPSNAAIRCGGWFLFFKSSCCVEMFDLMNHTTFFDRAANFVGSENVHGGKRARREGASHGTFEGHIPTIPIVSIYGAHCKRPICNHDYQWHQDMGD